ncbi:MAG: transport system permease protein [Steroidobacteraceae bacterium]|nr:transport system permease protein [Steroidobacteraceae bacterium]
MIWIDRLFAIAAKEARQLKRDRVTFGMIIGVPVIQMLLFGYAINFDVRDVDAAVLDQSRTSLSRQLVGDLQATQVLRVVHEAGSERELQKLMQRGDARVGIVIAADLERRLFEGDRSAVQLLVDGSQPSLEDLAQGLGSMPVLQRAGASAGGEPHFAIRTEYNPARRTAVQIVPALIGTILTMTMVIFTSGAIVRERERGNLELLITTPVTRGQLLAGKLLPYVIIGLIQTTLILGVGRLLFGVPMVGSLLDLYLGALVFIAASLALGLFISTIAQTQFQAFQMAFVTMLPSILLSGFMFPFEGMPEFAQAIAQVLPLTHFNEIVRGITLRGATLADMHVPLLKLVVFLVVMFSLAAARFRKRLD